MIRGWEMILICVASISLAVLSRRREGTWFAPSAFVSLLWSAVILFSFISAPDYYFSSSALWYILLNITVFAFGGMMAKNPGSVTVGVSASLKAGDHSKLFDWIIGVGVISGFTGCYLLLDQNPAGWRVIFDVKKLINVSGGLALERYGGYRLSGSIMACLAMAYLASFVAGMRLAFSSGRRQLILFGLLFVPILTFAMIYTARAVVLFQLLIVVATYLAFYLANRNNSRVLFSWRNILLFSGSFIFIVVLFFLSQAARMQITDIGVGQLKFLADYLRVWFSGNLSSFSIWFDSVLPSPDASPGNKTFAGISELFQSGYRKPGIYQQTFDVNQAGEFSNIYTLYRFIVDDFGAVGCVIFHCISGYLAKSFQVRLIYAGSFTSGALLSGILLLFLWSFVSSLFAYNSIVFPWIGFVLLIYLITDNTQNVTGN